MATSRDTVQLLIEILGQDGLDKLAQAAERASTSAKKAAGSYEVLDTVVNKSVGVAGTYEIATDRVNHELDEQVRKAIEATQAQKAMNMVMSEFGSVATAAAGSGQHGAGGRGIMGASYALQDFTSVLTGGGGLARALGSITNNFDQMAMAAGASVATAAKLSIGFTGLVALLPIVTPLFESLWKAMAGGEDKGPETVVKALDAAQERLEKIRGELDKILKSTPSGGHETAQGFRDLFAEEGGGKIVGGLAQSMAASGRGATMTDAERHATSDDAVEREVQVAQMNASRAGRSLSPDEEAVIRARARANQQAAKDAAQSRINTANVEAAGKIVGAAPTEKGARDTLRAMAGRFPGAFPSGFAGHLGEMEPEAVAKGEAEDAEAEAQEGRIHERLEKRRKDRAAKAAQDREAEQVAEKRRRQEEAAAKAAARAEERQQADEQRDLERSNREWQRGKKGRAHAGIEAQADQLMANGVGIVGQAFGPRAAAMASNASPAEVQAMKERTMANLEHGQLPADAILSAFQQVADAAARSASQNQQFVSRLNRVAGMTSRLHRGTEQTPMSSGLQR
jgi:hypothetical protein